MRKPVSKQDLETTQLSIIESFGKEMAVGLYDDMYPAGPVSGK